MTRRTQTLLAQTALAATLLAACGNGGSSGGSGNTTAPTTTTTSAESTSTTTEASDADRDAYVTAMAESLSNDIPTGVSDDEIQCAAEGMIDAIGVDRLVELEIEPDDLATASDFSEFDQTPTIEEARAMVDAIYQCIDMNLVFSTLIAAEFANQLGSSAPDEELLECFAVELDENDALREFFAQSFVGEVDEQDVQQQFLPAFFACFDWASFFIEQFEATIGQPLTAESVACIEEEIGDGSAVNDRLLEAFENGEDLSTVGSDMGFEIVEQLSGCLTEEERAALGIT